MIPLPHLALQPREISSKKLQSLRRRGATVVLGLLAPLGKEKGDGGQQQLQQLRRQRDANIAVLKDICADMHQLDEGLEVRTFQHVPALPLAQRLQLCRVCRCVCVCACACACVCAACGV
eukprot:COSAG01_NODE_1118_length_11634_cov_21.281838_7_plen_120_part_00